MSNRFSPAFWNAPPLDFGHTAGEETALVDGAGVTCCLDRSQLALRGADRASFLHNLCTNDIKKLTPGTGCEAFLLNAQGKTLGHVYVFAEDDQLVLDTVAGQGEFLGRHLDRYLIREKVEIAPLPSQHDLLLAGAQAAGALQKAGVSALPSEHGMHTRATLGERSVGIRKVDLAGADSWLISCDRDEVERVWNTLIAADVQPCGSAAAEAARIAAGTPLFGREITDANLPQELNRDHKAISFTKGCYLGQETVARIDALGHVNRLLVGLRGAGMSAPAIGAELLVDGKPIGAVTSVACSLRFGGPIALGYVRRALAQPGTIVQSATGDFTVTALPMAVTPAC